MVLLDAKSMMARLLFGSLLTLHCTTSFGQERQIEANFASVPPVIDGNPNDSVWKRSKPVYLEENRSAEPVTDSRLTTTVRACYDTDKLYLSFYCMDPDIWSLYTQRDDHL